MFVMAVKIPTYHGEVPRFDPQPLLLIVFLLIQILGDPGEGSSNWSADMHVGDLY